MTGKRAGNDFSIFVLLQAWAPSPVLEDYICCSVARSCPTLCDPMDCSPPGFSVHGIFQARILEWAAIPSPGDLPHPGIEPVSPPLQVDSLLTEPPGKPWANKYVYIYIYIYIYIWGISLSSLFRATLTWKSSTQGSNPGLQHCGQTLPPEPPGVLEPPHRETWCSSPCPGWLCCRCSLLQVLCGKKQRSCRPVAWMVGSNGSKCGWPDPPCLRVPSLMRSWPCTQSLGHLTGRRWGGRRKNGVRPALFLNGWLFPSMFLVEFQFQTQVQSLAQVPAVLQTEVWSWPNHTTHGRGVLRLWGLLRCRGEKPLDLLGRGLMRISGKEFASGSGPTLGDSVRRNCRVGVTHTEPHPASWVTHTLLDPFL